MLSLRSHCRHIPRIPYQYRSMKVVPVLVSMDNYAYLLIDESTNKAAAIDPYDVSRVSAAADAHGVEIVANITTHHHFDHSGGNQEFSESFDAYTAYLHVSQASKYPKATIYGGSNEIPALTKLLHDKDEFSIGDHIHVRCLATPCHTRDSICYYATDTKDNTQPGGVFTGDTLFIAGCGRFFEGVGSEMISALNYLGTLPDQTVVYNGHEYTAGSLAFGKHIDPANPGLARLSDIVQNNKITTGLTTIGDEKEWNVFMRLDSEAVKQKTALGSDTSESAIMNALREQKNKFRG